MLSERHLERLISEFIIYYHDDRTHLVLEMGTPAALMVAREAGAGSRVIAMSKLGGLHHRYDLAA